MNASNGKAEPSGNRFIRRTGQRAFASKGDYLKALSRHLSPDVWDAIIVRTIHDATFGKPSERTKARDWIARHILPYRVEIELREKEHRGDYGFLAEVYQLCESKVRTPEDATQALALTFGALNPNEFDMLKAAIIKAEGEEIRKFWDDARAEGVRMEKERRTERR